MMTNDSFKNFLELVEQGKISYSRYVAFRSIMTPFQVEFLNIYWEIKIEGKCREDEIFDDFEKGTWTPTLQNSDMKNDNYSICDNGVVIK